MPLSLYFNSLSTSRHTGAAAALPYPEFSTQHAKAYLAGESAEQGANPINQE
jgi:hypothetical protein